MLGAPRLTGGNMHLSPLEHQLTTRKLRLGPTLGSAGLPHVPGMGGSFMTRVRPLESDVRKTTLLPKVIGGYR